MKLLGRISTQQTTNCVLDGNQISSPTNSQQSVNSEIEFDSIEFQRKKLMKN